MNKMIDRKLSYPSPAFGPNIVRRKVKPLEDKKEEKDQPVSRSI